ncbi:MULTISPECIES: ABC transporter substrate-binding protein [unclassified Bradyrhizobium]|uniref:ABC transporter substrate-binding protein n=1 Tax=unclassified Bradyrhizobium TaxID=2631580 RepID=UPI001BADFE34|nr:MULTISPECIES: ABC transporter substrate-binding protein [unclassified Bradyrhizobium]MBR1224225.1 ABC transporter substrate-binding protein [Bradyrhizobium sp. AUGA SZCCT0176]MBR1301805.1 ABC transporter substrate-binding protein [Bradyrhizobium sp. AUGA SZCCT0042]
MIGMRRRRFIALCGGAAAWPLVARAQQPMTKLSRIGWLVTGSPASYRYSLAAFLDGLKALGYVEGGNIGIEYRWAEGDVARLPKLANELVEQKVDIILAGGSPGAEAAKQATSLIPIVAAGVGDLVELRLVTSLARPGGNLTGFVANAPETVAKRLQIMKEIMPQAKRAAVLWNSISSNAKLEWATAKEFAAANGIVVALYDARGIDELSNVLATVPQSDPGFLVVLNDPFMFTYRKVIVDAATRFRLPSIYGFREFVDDGGMISYGVSISDTYRRAASYVDRILRGEKPANLPVQLPTRFELVVNLKTAKALGYAFPDSFLVRADEVIE